MAGNNNRRWNPGDIDEILDFPASDEVYREQGLEGIKNSILDNIQVNIIKASKHKYTLFCFLAFNDAKRKEIVAWLKNMPLTSALHQEADPKKEAVGLYLSYEGYLFFCKPEKLRHFFPVEEEDDIKAFMEGLSKRCPKAFGDAKSLHPNYRNPSHALILIASGDNRLNEWNKEPQSSATRKTGLEEFFITHTKTGQHSFEKEFGKVFFEIGLRNPEGSDGPSCEWFGFRDGFSNPHFFPRHTLPFKPDPPSPLSIALRRNRLASKEYACGSFVVFLKLEQNKAAFENKVKGLAEKLGMEDYKGLVAAYLMGRHKDGTPLHESFNFPTIGNKNLNDFDFSNDKAGEICPLNSHIRKANPRDGRYVPRIVRRGKAYGHPDSQSKGILFLSYQSSVRQFEDIVNNGLYGNTYNNKFVGKDVLFIGKGEKGYQQNNRYMNAFGKPRSSIYLKVDKELVTFKGGQYFFASSISFIRESLEYFI